jgi:hypothetical protein
MRNIFPAILVAVLATAPALAEPSGRQSPVQQTSPGRLLQVKPAAGGNACAAYGPGFVKVAGSDTCVKIGGAVSIGVGGSSSAR